MSLLLLHSMRRSQTIARSTSFMRTARSFHSFPSIRSTTSSTPTPTTSAPSSSSSAAASASSISASLSDATAALSSAPSTALSLAQMDRARYHRRARLWLLAFFTSSTAVLTLYRYVGQREQQEANIKQANEDVRIGSDKLKQAQEAQQVRLQKVQQLLQAAAPANTAMIAAAATPAAVAASDASSSSTVTSLPTVLPPPAVPTSFISAAVLDVQRVLSIAAPDDRVQIAAVGAPKNASTTADVQVVKPRQAIIM